MTESEAVCRFHLLVTKLSVQTLRSFFPTLKTGVAVSVAALALPLAGQTWVQTTAPATNWSALSCSADATKVFAAARGGQIYSSTDSGVSWNAIASPVATTDRNRLIGFGCDYLVARHIQPVRLAAKPLAHSWRVGAIDAIPYA